MKFIVELDNDSDSDNSGGVRVLEIAEGVNTVTLTLHNPERRIMIDRDEWKRLCKMTG